MPNTMMMMRENGTVHLLAGPFLVPDNLPNEPADVADHATNLTRDQTERAVAIVSAWCKEHVMQNPAYMLMYTLTGSPESDQCQAIFSVKHLTLTRELIDEILIPQNTSLVPLLNAQINAETGADLPTTIDAFLAYFPAEAAPVA